MPIFHSPPRHDYYNLKKDIQKKISENLWKK